MAKARESGMPDEVQWESYFSPACVLDLLGFGDQISDVAEFGCGYGTFTLAAARKCTGTMYAFDIDSQMIARTKARAADQGIANIQVFERDFVARGTGLAIQSCDYAMIFNLLHLEQPVELLREAWRILQPNGKVGVIHWVSDRPTPRGPSTAIRPSPEQCIHWATEAGFAVDSAIIDLPPYHFGLVGIKTLGTRESVRDKWRIV